MKTSQVAFQYEIQFGSNSAFIPAKLYKETTCNFLN